MTLVIHDILQFFRASKNKFSIETEFFIFLLKAVCRV
jgi:hypothetical protein